MCLVRFPLALLLSITLVVLAGCGSSASDGFKGERGQVSGAVTLDGAPLKAGCQVLFIAKDAGYTGAGMVDDQGKYTLKYRVGGGLPVGEYLVQFSAPVVENSPTEKVDPVQMASKMNVSRKMKGESESPFPKEYSSTSTSGLFFKVKGGANTADFKLTKK